MISSRSALFKRILFWFKVMILTGLTIVYASRVYSLDIPKIKDLSLWDVPDLNPEVLQEGRFYYGIQVNGELYFTVLTRDKDSEIGKRAGGHFKLVKGWMMDQALKSGRSQSEAEAIGLRAFKLQAAHKERFHPAQGFGFKAVGNEKGNLVLKWHGFNSIKSTIHKTSMGNSVSMQQIIYSISKNYGIGSEIVHPILDPDLKINPKYLDPTYENYRGEAVLWKYTRQLAREIIKVNNDLGYSNAATENILKISRLTPGGCGSMFSRVLDFFGL